MFTRTFLTKKCSSIRNQTEHTEKTTCKIHKRALDPTRGTKNVPPGALTNSHLQSGRQKKDDRGPDKRFN